MFWITLHLNESVNKKTSSATLCYSLYSHIHAFTQAHALHSVYIILNITINISDLYDIICNYVISNALKPELDLNIYVGVQLVSNCMTNNLKQMNIFKFLFVILRISCLNECRWTLDEYYYSGWLYHSLPSISLFSYCGYHIASNLSQISHNLNNKKYVQFEMFQSASTFVNWMKLSKRHMCMNISMSTSFYKETFDYSLIRYNYISESHSHVDMLSTLK